jgi:hypothetical protein
LHESKALAELLTMLSKKGLNVEHYSAKIRYLRFDRRRGRKGFKPLFDSRDSQRHQSGQEVLPSSASKVSVDDPSQLFDRPWIPPNGNFFHRPDRRG